MKANRKLFRKKTCIFALFLLYILFLKKVRKIDRSQICLLQCELQNDTDQTPTSDRCQIAVSLKTPLHKSKNNSVIVWHLMVLHCDALPYHVRTAPSLTSFRKMLKSHFFNMAFPPSSFSPVSLLVSTSGMRLN